MKKENKDLILAFTCGFLAALFSLLIILNPKIEELAFLHSIRNYVFFLLILFPFMFVLGIRVAFIFKKNFPLLFQLAKFVEVGVLNTLVDFGILNFLLAISEVTLGFRVAILNSVSFLAAVINSYFWNKTWTFEKETKFQHKEFSVFLVVSIIGLILNSSIVYFGTLSLTFLKISTAALVNLVKIFATFIVMFWNFFGYKIFVFEKK